MVTGLQSELDCVHRHLCAVRARQPEDTIDSKIGDRLNQLKKSAVDSGDEALAKTLWCLQTVQHYQNRFIGSFNDMKARYYYDAWCGLAAIETGLFYLERHIDFNVCCEDAYSLLQIRKCVEQFQRLFPYALFTSPEWLITRRSCTICGQVVSLRNPCPHKPEEIYNGEFCSRLVEEVRILGVADVENPFDKRNVLFFLDSASRKPIDNYNYANVYYAVENLKHPFSEWDLNVTKRRRLTSDFNYLGRNDRCPCGSGDKFKKCCMRKKYLMRNHFDIRFHDGKAQHMPDVFDNAYIKGQFRAT